MGTAFAVRPARPDDIPALYLLKWRLALAEGSTHTVRASEADWQRDMFGPQPRFSAVVAETRAHPVPAGSGCALDSRVGACPCRRTGTHPGSSPGQAFAGTCADSTIIGMATIAERFSPGWVGALLSISDLFVLPEHPRAGVGRALLTRAATEAIRRGAPFLELMVRADNPARRLYAAAGFARVRGAEIYVLAGDALLGLACPREAAASA